MRRLATVIGHAPNLLPHFLNHYENIVDEINIVIYKSHMFPDIEREVRDIVEHRDKKIKVVRTVYDRVFDWEKVTFLYNFMKSQYPQDWWIIADIDEFQLYPYDNISDIINQCEINKWDIVRGGFIDRIGVNGEFSEILSDISIWKQFPNAGFFRYPMSDACPNKICIMKGYVEITAGQHYAKINGQTTWRWQGWNHPLIAPYKDMSVQVHHFKWDSTSIERIKAVADIQQDYAFSEEYSKMYNALKHTGFKIDLNKKEYMFETTYGRGNFYEYSQWNKLIKKIVSI
jgi:hypothetical protein